MNEDRGQARQSLHVRDQFALDHRRFEPAEPGALFQSLLPAQCGKRRQGPRVIIVARKKIQPGEEITYDYGKDYFDIFLKPIGCQCDKCREKRAAERAEKRLKKIRAERRAAAARQEADSQARQGRCWQDEVKGEKAEVISACCSGRAAVRPRPAIHNHRSRYGLRVCPPSPLRLAPAPRNQKQLNSRSTARSWYWPGAAGAPVGLRDCA